MENTLEDRLLLIKIFNAYKAKKRDSELEQEIIAKGDPDAACLYAVNVVRGAWEAAEHIITKAAAYDWRNGKLTRFPDSDGNVVFYHRKGSPMTTNVNDPKHTLPNESGWQNSRERLICKSTSQIATVYTRLTKKRHINFERNTKVDGRWQVKKIMTYVKLIYNLTGEIADFENGLVAVEIINAIKDNDFSKKPISLENKEKIIKELEQRMTLYSFTGTQNSVQSGGRSRTRGRIANNPMDAIKSYFESRVEAMNKLMEILGEHDENMTIGELKKFLRNEKAA
jgi:hypothetical protein